jgi:hypothetical protein
VTTDEELERADQARRILEDSFFQEHVRMVEEAILAGMRNAAIKDDKLRLRLLDRYELLHSLLACLRSTMETGMVAKAQIEAEQNAQSLRERFKAATGF